MNSRSRDWGNSEARSSTLSGSAACTFTQAEARNQKLEKKTLTNSSKQSAADDVTRR